MRILLVSPDQSLQNILHQDLSRHNLIVDPAGDGEEAWELLQAFMYDLVLLEAILPKLDGISLCCRLRDVGNPVLILLIIDASASCDCAQALEAGADACVEKPIQQPELLAYIRALARRGTRRASPLLSWGPLQLNPTTRQVTCHGQILKINRKEYQILELFLNHPRQKFPRSEISDRLWALDQELPTDATIKSHIRSVRRKLEQAGAKDFIQTHYGFGYCLNPANDNHAKLPSTLVATPEPTIDTITANLWQELMTANARLQQEIEQRKQVEAHLRRSEMMLRTAQQVAQIGSWEFDIQNRETYWTEELYLIHGLDPNQPAPTDEEIVNLIHPDDHQIHEEAIRAPASQGKAFEANLRIIRNDGEVRYINARGGPVFDGNGRMTKLTGTTFDITRWIKTSENIKPNHYNFRDTFA